MRVPDARHLPSVVTSRIPGPLRREVIPSSIYRRPRESPDPHVVVAPHGAEIFVDRLFRRICRRALPGSVFRSQQFRAIGWGQNGHIPNISGLDPSPGHIRRLFGFGRSLPCLLIRHDGDVAHAQSVPKAFVITE